LELIDIIGAKRQHLERLANQKGAAGEIAVVGANGHWVSRPKGKALKVLMSALRESGILIKPSSFDAIAIPNAIQVDFRNIASVTAGLQHMVFVEIKTANQSRVKADFSGFFFALTENEITASDVLGARHRVLLYNRTTDSRLLTSVPEIIARARSTTWQVSVQL
jgi:hypothetical protein